MNHFHHTGLVKVPAHKLYAIITDIEAYPHIIKQCQAAQVTSRKACLNDKGEQSEQVVASLTLRLGVLKREFVTRNIHTPCSSVEVDLHSGSMQKLSGVWQLTELGENTTSITCDFHFSLGNSAMDAIAAKFLHSYLRHSIEHYIAYAERQK